VELVKDEDIDFNKYLETPRDAARVKPASSWCGQVIDRFYGDNPDPGALLPFQKTHGKIKLRPGELSIFGGYSGHGKSMILNHIMLWVMMFHRACIASMEMKPVQTMHRMSRQAIGTADPSIDYIKRFHAWTDGKLWLYDQVGTVKPERMIALLRYCAEELKIEFFVIDSLMKCGINQDDYNRQKSFIDELCACAKDINIHICLVAHSKKAKLGEGEDQHIIAGSSDITNQADNIFLVQRNKRKEYELQRQEAGHDADEKRLSEPDSFLSCLKQRHGEWDGRVGLYFDQGSQQYRDDEYGAPTCILDHRLSA